MTRLIKWFSHLKFTDKFTIEILICDVFGYFCAIVFALSGSHRQHALEIMATLCLLQAATALVGIMSGFLFGIPRAGQNIEDSDHKSSYSPNTNLEQVSDWLTKILVGVGLTQFSAIIGGLNSLVESISAASASLQDARNIILASIVYKFVLGFFGSYVVTRLRMATAFSSAEDTVKEATIDKLVNLEFELAELSHKEQQELLRIIAEQENGTDFSLDANFDTNDELSQIYATLQRQHLIQLKEGDTWKAGSAIELTPIATKLLIEIKNELLSLNSENLN